MVYGQCAILVFKLVFKKCISLLRDWQPAASSPSPLDHISFLLQRQQFTGESIISVCHKDWFIVSALHCFCQCFTCTRVSVLAQTSAFPEHSRNAIKVPLQRSVPTACFEPRYFRCNRLRMSSSFGCFNCRVMSARTTTTDSYDGGSSLSSLERTSTLRPSQWPSHWADEWHLLCLCYL